MLLRLNNLNKSYGAVAALKNLTVDVGEGAVGLLGPNGSGKTTLIRALLGLISIDSGEGEVLGIDIRKQSLDVRQVVGLVSEEDGLFPGLTGVEFVAYGGELSGMNPSDALQRAHEVLDHVGLGEARYRGVESYSTGMRQRLKLASAIVHDPKLLILDEPTNGLDPAGRAEILDLARNLTRKGMNLLFSSHLLQDVEQVCDAIVVLGNGAVRAHGRMDELMKQRRRLFELRVKSEQEPFAERLKTAGLPVEFEDELLLVELPAEKSPALFWETASGLGVQIRHLRERQKSLEDVFLQVLEEKT